VGALSLYLNFINLFMLMLRLTTPSAGASSLSACK
jgi:FtsH-binding integral membrane protein